MSPEIQQPAARGWRLPSSRLSLPEVHGSIAVPDVLQSYMGGLKVIAKDH